MTAAFTYGTITVKATNCIGSSSTSTKTIYGPVGTPIWSVNSGADNQVNGVCGGSSHDYEVVYTVRD